MMPKVVTVLLLLGASLGVLLHLTREQSSLPLRGSLVALSLLALFFYSDYGRFQWIRNPPAVASATGAEERRALFHWHEIFHYYLGSKYYRELKNSGLYEAVALADSESAAPMIGVMRIRDLSDPMRSISIDEAKERARLKYKPNFAPARWQEFKDDLEYMKSIAATGWLDLGLFDAGFNPPPTWNVIGTPIANILPLSHPWTDYGPRWSQAEFLPLIDVALFFICCGFIFRAFALEGLSIFLIVFGTAFLSNLSWIAGSYLRYTFFFGIALGICLLRMRRFFWSGAFLGLSACLVVFPIVFLAGAFLMLLQRFARERTPSTKSALLLYTAGAALIISLMGGISLIQFGPSYWGDFFRRIIVHKDIFFVWHIGYRRIAVWDSTVPGQNFWWAEGLERFRLWNEVLLARWDSGLVFHYPLTGALLALCVFAMRRLRVEEGTMLFGGFALFLLFVPATYYYVYAALIPMMFFRRDENDWRSNALLAGFFLFWGTLYFLPLWEADDLINNYRVCWAVFLYFLFWLALRVFDRHEKPRLTIAPCPRQLSSTGEDG